MAIVQLKRSAVPGAAPTTGQLSLGELAINTYDGKVYIKKNVSGTESVIQVGGYDLSNTPSAPPPGIVRLGESSIAGVDWPSYRSAQTGERFFNPLLNLTKFFGFIGNGGANITPLGCLHDTAITRDGTSGNLVDSTSFRKRQHSNSFLVPATAGSMRRLYSIMPVAYMANASGTGGFLAMIRFIPGDNWGTPVTANSWYFLGLGTSTSEPTNTNPGGIINQIGIGRVTGSNNLHFIYGGSTPTIIDLGASYPATDSSSFYELSIWSDSTDATRLRYVVNRWTGANATITNTTGIQVILGTPGTNFPLATSGLCPRIWISNNTDAANTAIGVQSFFVWSE